MTVTSTATSLQEATVLLFGDQTDSWIDDLDQLYLLASSVPWLQRFLDDLNTTIKDEIKSCRVDREIQNSLGHFSSLQELGERYRNVTDEIGMARCLLLHTVRAGTLLHWVKSEPQLLGLDSQTEWLGISGGLLTLSALPVSEDFDELYDSCLQVARLLVRLCIFTSIRSRAMEDQSGNWGWAILGLSPTELRDRLEAFQSTMGIPEIKRAQIGVTGSGWSTIIGPPSVLELVVKQCPGVRNATKNPLNIHALQHTVKLSESDLDYLVPDDLQQLNKIIRWPDQHIWGMDEPTAAYKTWADMLRAICSQVLSHPLDIPQVVGDLAAKISPAKAVRVVQIGASSHAQYVANTFKTAGKTVSLPSNASLRASLIAKDPSSSGRIAIVGMSGRGPASNNYEEVWKHIMAKDDLCTEVPKDRFDIEEYYCPEHGKECTMTTKYGCFMDKPGHFDSRFFHISPREAMLMEPGHRQFLMSAYEALEMAGYSDGHTRDVDPNRIAAFYGQGSDDWHETSHPVLGCDSYTLQGVQRAFGPGRLAWQFKWEGPTYAVDSACAATISCVHLACMSLLSRDIDMAVAGAGNILSTPHSFICLTKSGVLSDTGNCKPFRDDADGYCRADFVGAVVLKRLEDAVAHNDNILAVISGSGRNHSGNSTSITSSDSAAQERLFKKVLGKAHVSPNDISYVEMHGTGTPVGDPAEMGAVSSVFKNRRRAEGLLPVGGVKGNFGHSEAAAGMVSLLKCVMMFRESTIPPQAGMPHALNPNFPPLAEAGIEIPSEPKPFPKSGDKPRRILLNNFDAAGGNACLVLEDYQDKRVAAVQDPRSAHVVVASARTQAAQLGNKRKLLKWLKENPEVSLQHVAYTTTARRMHHPIREAYTVSTVPELVAKLEETKDSVPSVSKKTPPVVFLFTGQGSHYSGMGSELYRSSPVFRDSVDLCVSLCQQLGFPPFLDLITDGALDITLKSAAQTQLALLSLEIGLVALWRSAGVQPDMVMGHSLGEYAAFYTAGVLSLGDVFYLVGKRALLLQDRLDPSTYSMLAVSMSVEDTRKYLDARPQFASCGVACMNGPSATVISGSSDDISKLEDDFLKTDSSMKLKMLPVPYGFHSHQMDPILDEYLSIAEGVTYSPPKISVASSLLGSVVNSVGTFSADYLSKQTRQPVDFVGSLHAVKTALQADPIWLEVGPAPVCGSFVRATLSPSPQDVLSTLKPKPSPAWTSISSCLGNLYTRGLAIDWLAFHKPYNSNLRLLELPAYEWDMKDYWITFSESNKLPSAPKQLTGGATPMISTCAQYVVEESAGQELRLTLGASLAEAGFSAVLNGHKMEGNPIAAGSIFCEAAYAAAIHLLKTNGRDQDAHVTKLGLRAPNMTRPLTKNLVGEDGELHTTVLISKKSPNDIQVRWKAISSKGTTCDLGTCRLEIKGDLVAIQANWDWMSSFVKARVDQVISDAKAGHGHRLLPALFYSLFSRTVEYAPNFKGVQEAFVSTDFSEAVAEVILQPNPAGTSFAASPYWGENLTHLAGFLTNSNPSNAPDMTFINGGFESFHQTVAFEAAKPYQVYVRLNEKSSDSRVSDVFVFDSGKLVAQCVGCHFHEIKRAVLSQVLGGGKAPAPAVRSAPAPPQKKETVPLPETKSQVNAAPVEETKSKPQAADSGVMDTFLSIIAQETGVSVSELTNDTALADLGVDSIMAIEISAKVSRATGLELTPTFAIDNPTIEHLRAEFGSEAVEVDTPTEESSGNSSEDDREYDMLKEETSSVDSFPSATTPAAKQTKPPSPVTQPTVTPLEIDDSVPQPAVQITLLKGRSRRDAKSPPPFYMIADGTGSIATYIHLPQYVQSRMAFYGVDSPFLRCPTRITGISSAASLIVAALVKKQPKGVPFWIGGFSGGAMISYEVCRLLREQGHEVDALLLIDMCCPREHDMPANTDVGLAMFDAISGQDDSGVWNTTDNTSLHLQALFNSVATYHPPKGIPPAKRTGLIWAAKGMIARCEGNTRLEKLLAEHGISTTAYPGFMEDPKFGAVAWSLPHKTAADLGPNGWDAYVGKDLVCLSIEADHLEMPTPSHAQELAGAMEKCFDYFRSE